MIQLNSKHIVSIVVCLLVYTGALAQFEQLDTRIDNNEYWKEMAKKGLTTLNPDITSPPAQPVSDEIRSYTVLNMNSPDVPVTNNTNNTQSENSIFVNPNNTDNVVNSNNSQVGSSFAGTSGLFSNNGGTTWGGTLQGAGGANSGDPAVAIGNDGTWYVGHISTGFGQGVSYSTNNGASWTAVNIAPSGTLDKNHLWIDNSTASPHEGNLYNSWTIFSGANNGEIEMIRSTNNALNWTNRTVVSSAINAGSHNQGVNVQTGPNGEVYAVWTIYDSWPSDESALGFTRSTNGGVSYTPATRILSNIRGIRQSGAGKNQRTNAFPVMAVDISNGPNSGNIYVVWSNIGVPGTNSGSTADIYMIRSTNGGTSWSSPIRVNQDPINANNQQYFPWITCDPVTGHLSVVFYDDRNVGGNQVEVFVANSLDGGTTWDDFRVSDVSFTPSPIPGLAGGYFGDYLGITARNGMVYPVWTDNRTGKALGYVSPFVISSCPVNLALQNITITIGQSASYEASNNITAAGGGTTFVVQGNGTTGGKASFTAGNSIRLLPGFTVQQGGKFLAAIGACATAPVVAKEISKDKRAGKAQEEVLMEITMHPNPTAGVFQMDFAKKDDQKVVVGVFDLLGREVCVKEITESKTVEFDISQHNKGVYLVRIAVGDKVYTKRILYR